MEEIIDAVCDYVKKPYTDYAVMINGEWGSGKTYFWNNQLRNRLETLKIGDTNYKTIYMSLYGINSLEEISKKIFIEANPTINKTLRKFSDNKKGNIIPEFVKTGLDMANLFGNMNVANEKVDFAKIFSIEDKILCFDDLERANVDVIDILGYINNFVEHDGIKTILICNENELATKFKNSNLELKTFIASYILDKEGSLVQNNIDELDKPLGSVLQDKIADIFDRANAYERIKEKLIGETFEYIPEYAYILNGMIMKYSYNEELSTFYKKNTYLIISTFKKSDTRNLRILKHALNDFEKIFNETVKTYPRINQHILQTMLIFTVALSFEIKSGSISKDKLKEIRDNDEYNSSIFTSKMLNDKNQFYLREFDNKYFINAISNYRFFKFIEVYVRTRYFDDKLFRENMDIAFDDIFVKKETKQVDDYIQMVNGDYWKLNDSDFEVLWRNTIDSIKDGKVNIRYYIKLYVVYKYLINLGIVDYNLSNLRQDIRLGMNICASNHTNSIDEIMQDLDESIDNHEEDIKELNEYFEIVKTNAYDILVTNHAKALFKLLPESILEFYQKIVNDYVDVPVFSKYDMEDLHQKLTLVSNYDLYNIINLFTERYKQKDALLELDIKNLRFLAKIIRQNTTNEKKTIKIALLENLAKQIEHLDS